jgi:hypothetical protein
MTATKTETGNKSANSITVQNAIGSNMKTCIFRYQTPIIAHTCG